MSEKQLKTLRKCTRMSTVLDWFRWLFWTSTFSWTSHFWKLPLLLDSSWALRRGPCFWAAWSVVGLQDVLAVQLKGDFPNPQQTVGSNGVPLILIQTFADSSPLAYHSSPQTFLELAPTVAEGFQGWSYRILNCLPWDFMWLSKSHWKVTFHPWPCCLCAPWHQHPAGKLEMPRSFAPWSSPAWPPRRAGAKSSFCFWFYHFHP